MMRKFDGDEMNLHMPQDIEAESELRNLAAIPYQIISPANNASIIGIFQDSMLGAYRFTRENISFTQKDAMNLLMMFNRVNPEPLLLTERVSNFELLTQILPPLSLKTKNKQFDSENEDTKISNNVIEIKNGTYLRGQMDKGILGSGTKGLIHRVCNDFGNFASANFIDDLQNIITEYMKQSAFSVGISDLATNTTTNEKIMSIINEKKNEVKSLIEQVQIGVFENNTGKTNNEEFETKINNILSKAQSEAGRQAIKSLDKDNRFIVMLNAGSKGTEINIQQMTACLGQQNVDGKRIPYGFEHRTLPHYTKYDDSPIARGFVESSYINGLTPQELFFHAMGGRIGLIDTAVKTSTTGYIQRRLIKGLEDLMVNYDMTIRTNKSKIVQFTYGDDSFDTTKVESQELHIVEMSIQDIYAHYNIIQDKTKSKTLSGMFIKTAYNRLKKQESQFNEKCQFYINYMIKNRDEIIKNVFNNKSNKVVRVPVAFAYIIHNTLGQQNINPNSLVDITLLEAYEMIEETYSKLEKIYYAPPNELFKVLYYYYLSPKDLLINKRFNKKALELLLENILLNYKRSIVAPGEMVGMIAAQSIGEPTTQLTLNSFTYETEILVRNIHKEIQKVKMGDFVTKLIQYGKEKRTRMEYYSDKDTTYAPTLDDEYWEIQAPDEDGNIDWYKIEAGTQHPVINEDGTNTMLKVITEDEQEIIATKAKSFLMLKNGKLLATRGDELVVGNYVPISTKIIDHKENTLLNLKDILPPSEYLYGSEAYKAMNYMDEYHWWNKYNNVEFILPYKRSDSFRDRMKDLRKGCENRVSIENGYVYPKKTWKNCCKIPENIPLDYDFGFLIGAYCAEGCLTRTQISISNNDFEYHLPIQRWCNKYNITTKQYKQENKNKEGWTSSDIRIYSIVLTDLIEKLCGKLSHGKFIHQNLIFSNEEFKKGFINGYIGGDGSVRSSQNDICSYSVSYQLLSDFNVMLKTLGIYSFIRKRKLQTSNNRGTKPENIRQGYTINIRNSSMVKLAKYLENNEIKYKAENARKLLEYIPKSIHNRQNDFIPNNVNGVIVMEPRDNKMKDTVFVKIKSIEEVPNTTDYAYDLTVEKTRNFVIVNGLEVVDTFHFAGVASKSNVTRGVPRIEEILSLSGTIKNPSLTVYLKPEDETDRDRANVIQYMLEHTKLEEVVKMIEICFDPDDLNTLIDDDKLTMSQYREFERLVEDCMETTITQDETERSKWIIRMEIDPEVMLEKNITMDDINFTLNNVYKDEIQCVYSDYNADKLIFRIRMNNILKGSKQKKAKINPLDQSDQIYILRNFQEQLLNNIVLRGVKKINKVILRKVKDNLVENSGIYKTQDIWVLDTIGSNLLDVLGLDYIDCSRTISNDIQEIYNVLGIEAARNSIYNELAEVIEFDGTYVNAHHFMLLCDRMTYTHKMISIFRHGINNDDIGPIAKASFEETPEMFLRAARHAELDNMKGISANVMCGQEGMFGTSAFQVVLDLNEMSKLEEQYKYEYKDDSELIEKELFMGIDDVSSMCSIQNLTIENNIVNIDIKETGKDDEYNPFA
jgi:DNA-directed RNA polymerase beta' subunit